MHYCGSTTCGRRPKQSKLTWPVTATVALFGLVFASMTQAVQPEAGSLLQDAKPSSGLPSRGASALPEDDSRLVAFFLSPDGSCPKDWKEAIYARGRVILGSKTPGKTSGDPFKPAQNPTHTHRYRVGWQGGTVERNWIPSSRSEAIAVPQAYAKDNPSIQKDPTAAEGETASAELGFPFFQAVLCQQQQDNGLVDVLPKDSVAYFNSTSCPAREDHSLKWISYEAARGRFIVPLVEKGTHEATVGTPWFEFFFRLGLLNHDHDNGISLSSQLNAVREMSTDASLAPTTLEASLGGNSYLFFSNRFMSKSLAYAYLNTSNVTTTDISKNSFPFYTLTVCRKQGGSEAAMPKPPANFTFFRATGECGKYSPVPATMGRFLVALPEHALPNQAFGEPLRDQERRTHSHSPILYNGSNLMALQVRSGGSGPTQGDVFDRGGYTWSITPAASSPTVPYIQLSHCMQKNTDASE